MTQQLRHRFAETAGHSQEDRVTVDISYNIIRQFSHQLYTNPRKAIEELVVNSYDAGATECYVSTPREPSDQLTVLDNGTSMDLDGLKKLWMVAKSPKENMTKEGRRVDNQRVQIGKFGVGKLASFALGKRLTHVTTVDGETRIVSVGEEEIQERGGEDSTPRFDVYKIPLREAKDLIKDYLHDLPFPWRKGWNNWTLAIVADIDKSKTGTALKPGYLKRMIRTSIPISSNFTVQLNGESIDARTIDDKDIQESVEVTDKAFRNKIENTLKSWWLEYSDEYDKAGEVPAELYQTSVDTIPNPEDVSDTLRALQVPQLGGVAGRGYIAERSLTTDKLSERGYQDHGFAVYVHGKLVNSEDPLFGISARSHTWWSRFYARLEVPGLDEPLLVQRNEVSEDSVKTQLTRQILRVLFNTCRNRAREYEASEDYKPESFGRRLQQVEAFAGERALEGLSGEEPLTPDRALSDLEISFESLGDTTKPVDYNRDEHTVVINEDHPIIVRLDEIGKGKKQVRRFLGEALAGNLLSNGYLLSKDVDETYILEAENLMDRVLRNAVAYLKDPVKLHMKEIRDAAQEGGEEFERSIARSFRNLGLSATRLGKTGESDGIIELYRPGDDNLLISVEDKGKRDEDGKVDHKDLRVGTIKRHRRDKGCTHALAVAPRFQLSGRRRGEESALLKEVQAEDNIALLTVDAIEKILRLQYSNQWTFDKLEKILTTFVHPDELEDFIEEVWRKMPHRGKMKEVLREAWSVTEQQADVPTPGMVSASQRMQDLDLSRSDIKQVLDAVAKSTGMLSMSREEPHEFRMKAPPEAVVEALQEEYPTDIDN